MLSRLNLGPKLMLLVLPFAFMTFVLSGVVSFQQFARLRDMQDARQLVDVAAQASALVDTLQAERGLTNGFLNGQGAVPEALVTARGKSDAALQAFAAQASGRKGELGQHAGEAASAVQTLLGKRGAIDSRSQPAPAVFADYSGNIERLIAITSDLAAGSDDVQVLRYGTALSNLLCAKELAGRERGFVNGVLVAGSFDQAKFAQAKSLQAQQEACLGQLQQLAPAPLLAALQPQLTAPEVSAVQALRDGVYGAPLGSPLATTPQQWFAGTSARIAKLKAAQDTLLEQLRKQVDTQVDSAGTELALIAGATSAMTILLLIGGFAVYRSIRRPVLQLEGMMTQMSHNLDLGVRARLDGQDEIARMGRALDALVDAFAGTLKVVKVNAHQLQRAAGALQGVSERAAGAAEAQSSSSTQIAAAVEQMSAGISSVSDNTQQNLVVAREMQRGVNEGRERMHATTRAIEDTAATVDDAGRMIISLAEKSQNIRQIITAIREIADQTNLLALNAAIEAARAGEQGRGFAVVADEVRKLAERTGKETVEIAQLIEVITGDTQAAATRMQQARGQMDQGMALVSETLQELELIHSEAEDTASKSQDTAVAMQQQTAASSEVAVNISRIAALAEDNAAIVQEAAELSEQLSNTSGELVQQVDRFKHTSA
ncbi:methyl-accepting chemotaxis protein [Vogesella sp. LIG4]|uniref:methyl-accepting chemotaxis protein n=1 Tax=Vogesella sp. LIG4 TaxID=1192162 RepID=UPI00081FB2ED|nr:methyl-accepting chemotaxis protein [Vogesella sp. LIG4]SCK29032.1 methyl-accepting chemotaxis protein [Vogesella sp. LIG4]